MNFTRQKTIPDFLRLSAPPPQSEIELLAAHVLRRPREFVMAHPQRRLSLYRHYRLSRLIKRRNSGVPLAYLTGRKEFYGLDFAVNEHVLIPRPETEILVELACNEIRNRKSVISNQILIDVGTGSGCIPISILKTMEQCNNVTITTLAIDISRSTLRVAKHNARTHGTKIDFLYGNLLSPVLKKSKITKLVPSLSRDLKSKIIITANLPYLAESWYNAEPSIHHEPKQALVAGEGGLALYERLLIQINALITSQMSNHCLELGSRGVNGQMSSIKCLMEIDPRQTIAMQKLICDLLPQAAVTIYKDLAGHDRVAEINLNLV